MNPISVCKIECAFQAGGENPSEDRLVCRGDLFGVFDGSSSLVPDLYEGRTGAWWASNLACSEFAKNNAPLSRLGERANERLRTAMMAKGVACEDQLACWSTSAAVLKIDGEMLEWLQIGDCQILAIERSGGYRLLTDYLNHDRATLKQLRRFHEQEVDDPHTALKPYVEQVRKRMNRDYGAMNGDSRALSFFNSGRCRLEGVAHLVLLTDGLLPPSETPEGGHDFGRLVDLYLRGGLEFVKKQVRFIERTDPECRLYPRFKKHDDIAAIALTIA
jgi:serine/threonine protein phosphatase PrpC